ncbi:phage portal protein [Trueperella sp. LYQ143]|uniref:phage portal protein n=1 Tax=unclassified Trueperella TaxID=2630174 RepID=UPI0039837A9F
MIVGLTDVEQGVFDLLEKQLAGKRRRNLLRSAYMDGKHVLDRLPPTAPPYLSQVRTVLGWPAKAVEMLARRIRLDGFAPASGRGGNDLGVSEILAGSHYVEMVIQAQVSALVHSTVFAAVTAGDVSAGEPEALVSFISALDGTGVWNAKLHALDSFLWVHRWGQSVSEGFASRGGARIESATLFLPFVSIRVEDGRVVDRQVQDLRVPVVQFPYKPRLDRPFGSSRISRPVMSLTDSAVRTVLRSEGTADFYGAPWFMVFGPDEDAFTKGSWQLIMDRVNAIPDNDDAANPRADVKQFSQASQQPHVDQLQVLAGLFAGETNIPVSSLGVGLAQANPTSAESYLASREDLIAEAEDAQATWSAAHRQVAVWAWQVANRSLDVPAELAGLLPVWRDTRFTSRAAAADATVKLVSVFPWMAESEAIIEQLGFDVQTTRRLLNEKQSVSFLAELSAEMERSRQRREAI